MGTDRRAHLARVDDDDMPTLDLHADSRSIDDDDAFDMDDQGDDGALPPTNRDADHHTIVDMNLRVVRFVIVVAVALVVAFAYATFTSQPHTLAHVATAALAESGVAFYNVIFGPTMFATSKVFEIYTETLIFPTLHTYLHNCSLYPGDEPQRTTSKIKTRAIFWGLKTVVILMNVGTASLFVSSRAKDPATTAAVAHSVQSAHTRRLEQQQQEALRLALDERFAAFLHRESLDPFAAEITATPTCGSVTTSKWTRADLDYTSVAFGFARRPWSETIVDMTSAASAVDTVELRLQDCVDGPAAACEQVLAAHGVGSSELAQLLARGKTLGGAAAVNAGNATLRDTAASLSTTLPSRDALLSVERRVDQASGLSTLAVAVQYERVVPRDAVTCGALSCVASVSARPLQEMWIQQLEQSHSFLTSATTRQALVSPVDGSVRELVTLSFATHSLPSSSPALRLTIDDDGTQVVVDDLAAVAPQPTRLSTLHNVVLPDASEWTTWLPIDHATPDAVVHACDPLVDAYVSQFQQTAALFDPSRAADTMATATLLFLTQYATYVPSEKALALARRLEETSGGSGEVVELRLSITAYSAVATFAGCGVMVLLMVFVILRPQARVRLTPNTTAAAQYVQILTDDLYPNIVHKKRLRFVNGEVLPFNEYVVDSIVLHAKRDTSKKIYL